MIIHGKNVQTKGPSARGPEAIRATDLGASGSESETTAIAAAGANKFLVENPGDFRAGHEVLVSRCHPHFCCCYISPVENPYIERQLQDEVELRGYDGSAGDWLIFLMEIDSGGPTFRWRRLQAAEWEGQFIPLTGGWQSLADGVEVRFGKRDWRPGEVVSFHARDTLFSRVKAIKGKTLILSDAASRSVDNAVVRHHATEALQAVLDRAVAEHRNVYLPEGRYRLVHGLTVSGASDILVEGPSAASTVLDMSEGMGDLFRIDGGRDVTLRRLSLLGNYRDGEKYWGSVTVAGTGYYTISKKLSRAVRIVGTEHVHIEDVHASRMVAECFLSEGGSRENFDIHAEKPYPQPTPYTRSVTYLRCSVTHCGFVAFGHNDLSEGVSILHCRAENSATFMELPSRFIRVIGNYTRNCVWGLLGSNNHRSEMLETLGCGQTIVADNVFEGGEGPADAHHQCFLLVTDAGGPVIISNNLFVNATSDAIEVAGGSSGLAGRNVTIEGNIIDLTPAEGPAGRRTGIRVNGSHVIVANNQVYVRAGRASAVTGIAIADSAVNVDVHDNLVQNCRYGIRTFRLAAKVAEVKDERTFCCSRPFPAEWWSSHRYRGWNVRWLGCAAPEDRSVIEDYDPATMMLTLKAPHAMAVGDELEMYSDSPNWNIHSNTVTACECPVVFDAYGGESAVLRDNIISRGGATGVERAVTMAGRCHVIGNHVSGFDEAGAVALYLKQDPRPIPLARGIMRGNIFERCDAALGQEKAGLLGEDAEAQNNFIACGHKTAAVKDADSRCLPMWRVPRLRAGSEAAKQLTENPDRAMRMDKTPEGRRHGSLSGRAWAGWDADGLTLVARFEAQGACGPFGPRDGMGLTFKVLKGNAQAGPAGPVLKFRGDMEGRCHIYGLPQEHMRDVCARTRYTVKAKSGDLACTWRIPIFHPAIGAAPGSELAFNIGMYWHEREEWVVWAPTGESIGANTQMGNMHNAGRVIVAEELVS